jgi:hypothetical protein
MKVREENLPKRIKIRTINVIPTSEARRNLVLIYQSNTHVVNEILRRYLAPQDDINCSYLTFPEALSFREGVY